MAQPRPTAPGRGNAAPYAGEGRASAGSAGAKGRDCYDLCMQPDRATALLAVVRIISVLGMALAISAGIFMLLGGWILPALGALAGFFPSFFVMRYMEKRAAREDY
jgi:hypothetical protein